MNEWHLRVDSEKAMAPHSSTLAGKSHGQRSLVGCSPWGCEESGMTERLHFHFHFHALEKEMATHSSVPAWRIPGTGEPSWLPSMGSHRVGHDWSDLAAGWITNIHYYYYLIPRSYPCKVSTPNNIKIIDWMDPLSYRCVFWCYRFG